MIYFSNKRKKRRKIDDNKTVIWIIVAFMIVVAVSNLGKKPAALQNAEQTVADKGLSSFESYKKKVLPGSGAAFGINDTTEGSGAAASCGQQVSVAYDAFQGDQPIDDHATKEKPLSFRIGAHQVMPALERGVQGMKVGGKRTIAAPFDMAYGVKEFARDDVKENAALHFDVAMLEANPPIEAMVAAPLRIAITEPSSGDIIECGQNVNLRLTLWNVEGKKLFESSKPVNFTVGDSAVFVGLEQGVLGMHVGEKRTLIIPPILQKTLSGEAPAQSFPLPENQTVLADIEAMP